ncbi:hypothetical protein D3C73_1217460 [compost metagenome]
MVSGKETFQAHHPAVNIFCNRKPVSIIFTVLIRILRSERFADCKNIVHCFGFGQIQFVQPVLAEPKENAIPIDLCCAANSHHFAVYLGCIECHGSLSRIDLLQQIRSIGIPIGG